MSLRQYCYVALLLLIRVTSSYWNATTIPLRMKALFWFVNIYYQPHALPGLFALYYQAIIILCTLSVWYREVNPLMKKCAFPFLSTIHGLLSLSVKAPHVQKLSIDLLVNLYHPSKYAHSSYMRAHPIDLYNSLCPCAHAWMHMSTIDTVMISYYTVSICSIYMLCMYIGP